MMARAFGPGRSVTSFGRCMWVPRCAAEGGLASRRCDSAALPARAGRRVLEQDTARGQILADPVGAGEVAALPGFAALDDQPLDLVDRDRWRLVLAPAHADEAEHEIEVVEGGA